MKKILTISIIMSFILLFIPIYSCYGYSTSLYSIDIPDNYVKIKNNATTQTYAGYKTKVNETIFQKSSYSTVINVITMEVPQTLRNEMKEFDNNDVLELLESSYEEYDSFYITNSKIKRITKNNYKCTCAEITAYSNNAKIYLKQYVILCEDNIYFLTIGATEKELLDTKELNSIVNSFTITDYKPVDDNNTLTILILMIIIVIVVFWVIYSIANRDRKRKKTTDTINIDEYNINNDYNLSLKDSSDNNDIDNELNIKIEKVKQMWNDVELNKKREKSINEIVDIMLNCNNTKEKIHYFYDMLLLLVDTNIKLRAFISTDKELDIKFLTTYSIMLMDLNMQLEAIEKMYDLLNKGTIIDTNMQIFYNKKTQTRKVIDDISELNQLYNSGLKQIEIYILSNGTDINNRKTITNISDAITEKTDILSNDLIALDKIVYD